MPTEDAKGEPFYIQEKLQKMLATKYKFLVINDELAF